MINNDQNTLLLYCCEDVKSHRSGGDTVPLKYCSTAILFACCYVTRWGRFGRVFCKQTSVAACRFQNECNKVEIALRVVQFWSEIKLMITNRTTASRSCDFVITRLISDQIALHSVQLRIPLLRLFSSYAFFTRTYTHVKV